ncbi:unnamed protein product, partial [Symbiodinium sp. CCMP2456]
VYEVEVVFRSILDKNSDGGLLKGGRRFPEPAGGVLYSGPRLTLSAVSAGCAAASQTLEPRWIPPAAYRRRRGCQKTRGILQLSFEVLVASEPSCLAMTRGLPRQMPGSK